ncbi:MAG: carboxypeptidase regulatory-like domain-containing protein [Thermodesulfobacteriota bacterium]
MKKSFNKMLSCTLLASAIMLPSTAMAELAIDFTDISGFGVDSDTVQIDNIRVDFIIVNPFDPTRPYMQSAYFNVPFDFDMATLHLVPSLGTAVAEGDDTNCSDATIYVTDAYTGSAVANAAVSIGGETVFTDANGMATFSGLTAGNSMVEAVADNYSTGSRSVTLSCTEAASLGLSLDPTSGDGALQASDVRITLAWGADPRDLDTHFTGPTSASTGISDETNRFHVYYGNTNADEVASLDVDDTSGYGPETITLIPPAGASTLRPGIYRYTVHHFSGYNNIATSNASVTLNIGGSSSREFLPPADATGLAGTYGDTWTVFELMVDSTYGITVLPIDTYASGTSVSDVRTTRTGYGSVEKGVDFGRLRK